MTDYLAPINRYQFAQFYRYGYTYVAKSTLLTFGGEISEETKRSLAEHFSIVSPFEYNEEYLVLHLTKGGVNDEENVFFEVQDISAIYPLSNQAKFSIQEKIDQRVRLEQPIFESVLPMIEAGIQKKEIEMAIEALWRICEIDGNKNEFLALVGMDNIFDGLSYRQHGTKAQKINGGNFWSILIAYDRYSFFPNTTLGLFYDLGEIFSYYKGKTDGLIGTKIFDVLETINKRDPSSNFQTIVKELDTNPLTSNFINDIKSISDNKFSPVIASTLFIRWRDELRNNESPIFDSTIFNKKTKQVAFFSEYPIEVKTALMLLACFYGFKKFYDAYYDKLNLRFFKAYSSTKEVIKDEVRELPITEEVEIEMEKTELPIEIASGEKYQSNQRTKQQSTPIEAIEVNSNKKSQIVEGAGKEMEHEANVDVNHLRNTILDIIKSKGEMSINNLGKELHIRLNKNKMKNEIIEGIIKDIPEIEKFKDKSTNKVRLMTTGLFNTLKSD